MKTKVLEGIRFFKENFPSSKSYIQRMQQIADGDIDFKTWQSTGLFVSPSEFKKVMPDVKLNKRCEAVVLYITLDYIESLSSGFFSCGRRWSRDLDVIEKEVYDVRY